MTDKFFTRRKLFEHYLPLTVTLFMLVTIERVVVTDGGNDRLYGFPFPYITSSYGYSFHYDVFVLPMLLNLVTFFGLTLVIYKLFEKIKHWIFFVISVLLSFFWLTVFIFTVRDSSFYPVDKSDYKVTSRSFVFGLRP
jgi:hypothetical protein